jgi:ABC-type multidrug transport system ATPase subunit
MTPPALTIQHLRKSFGSRPVLSDVSLSLAPGTLFGLVGLNGAGKTTLLRLILGLLRPSGGDLSVLGHTPWQHEPAYTRRLGVIVENDGFWGNLTFGDNIRVYAEAKGVPRSALDEYLTTFWSGIQICTSPRKVKLFSRGQRAQCAVARAFLGWPEMLVLDEPVVALDVEAYEHFCTLVRQARSRGCTMIISSHVLEPIETFCTSVGLLKDGCITDVVAAADASAGEPWLIVGPGDDAFGTAIGELAIGSVTFIDGSWRFAVCQPAEAIPRIIAALVNRGCPVREVRPDPQSLRSAVRRSMQRP